MASQLAQTAKTFRRMILGLFAVFVAYLILTQVYTAVTKIIASKQPVKPVPPSVAFGKLPKLNLKSLTLGGERPEFNLETTNGALPKMPEKALIYKFIEPQASFLSLERSKSLAKKLGFASVPKEVSPSLYFWQEEGGKTLRANTVTGNFQVDIDLFQMTLSVGDLPSPGEIKATAKGYLDSKGLLRSGYESGPQEVVLIKKNGLTLSKALSLSEASLARIDFFRSFKGNGDNDVLVLPKNPKKGLVEMFYTGTGTMSFPKIKYTVWEYDFEKGESYPLRPISAAWEEVRNGSASVAYLQHQGSDSLETPDFLSASSIYIRKIYLAYFDDENIQSYLQPIYVFEGDGKVDAGTAIDITIYTPAVDPTWIE